MPLIGDGAAGLTQTDPGASAWIAQLNANFLQVNNEQPWVSVVTAGEAIGAGKWVYLSSDSKVYLADWSDSNKRYAIGFCVDAITVGATGKCHHMGRVSFVSGESVGERLYLSTSGGMADAPGDSSDVAKKLVVGMQFSTTEFLVNVLHTMNAF